MAVTRALERAKPSGEARVGRYGTLKSVNYAFEIRYAGWEPLSTRVDKARKAVAMASSSSTAAARIPSRSVTSCLWRARESNGMKMI